MVAHMNAQALAKTIASGEAWYFSRSRGALWKKGETLRPHPARRRNAHRLRPGCGLDQGRAGRRRLPHRPPLVLLSRGAARQGGRGHAGISRRARVRSEHGLSNAITPLAGFAAFDAQPGVGQDFQPAEGMGLPHLSQSRSSLIRGSLLRVAAALLLRRRDDAQLPFDFPAAEILFQAAGLSGAFRDHGGFVISADRPW